MRRTSLVGRFFADACGQDLIEYGLLIGVITVALILILPTLQTHIGTVFTTWGTQTNSLWVPVAPAP